MSLDDERQLAAEAEERYERRRVRDHWHIGREIPIAVLFVLLVQTGGGIWWAATLSSDMRTVQAALKQFETERYTKEDARRDKELFLQLMESSRRADESFERRLQMVELHATSERKK